MVSQFSSDAAAALDREVELEAERGSFAEDISSYYELSRCSEWIKLGRFTKVGANTISELILRYGMCLITRARLFHPITHIFLTGCTPISGPFINTFGANCHHFEPAKQPV